jgi:4-hydroxybenzoyl-CoA thioesterase/acyl-CoA thioester hydrolase
MSRRVEFAETDAAGFVHFSAFFRYMEEAEHALWRASGLRIFVHDSDIHFPRLSTSFNFHSPLRFEDEFEVSIQVAAITDRTVRYTCVVTSGERKIATGTLIIACVCMRPGGPMRPADIPAEVVERLQAGGPARG